MKREATVDMGGDSDTGLKPMGEVYALKRGRM